MYGTSNKLVVGEIQIFDKKNQPIDYDDICLNCDPTYYETNRYRLKDNYYYSVSLSFKPNEILTLDLKEYYAMDDLSIRIYLYDNNINTIKHLKIKYTQDENFDTTEYAIGSINETFETPYLSSILPFDYNIDNMTVTNLEYGDTLTTEEYIAETQLRKVQEKSFYQTIDKIYKYEIIDKQYLDDFYPEPFDDYQKDETTETTFYRTQTRDKVIISDNLIIDNYDIDLYSFIESTTTDDIKITSNINLYRNGIYKINFVLSWKTITEDIIIDIKENYLLAIDEQNNTLKELEQQNDNLYKKINNFSSDVKELLKEKDNEINEVNEKLIEYQYENKELTKNKKEPKETTVKTDIKKYLLIIPILIIIIIIIIIFKNLSNQNNN